MYKDKKNNCLFIYNGEKIRGFSIFFVHGCFLFERNVLHLPKM